MIMIPIIITIILSSKYNIQQFHYINFRPKVNHSPENSSAALRISERFPDVSVLGSTAGFDLGFRQNVRYDIQLENDDKNAGAIGLTAGFTNGTSIVFEWNKSANSERYLFSGTIKC